MMREGAAPLIRREDYLAPAYWIRRVDLTLDLDAAKTIVASKLVTTSAISSRLTVCMRPLSALRRCTSSGGTVAVIPAPMSQAPSFRLFVGSAQKLPSTETSLVLSVAALNGFTI